MGSEIKIHSEHELKHEFGLRPDSSLGREEESENEIKKIKSIECNVHFIWFGEYSPFFFQHFNPEKKNI